MAQFVQQTQNVSSSATGATAGVALAANSARVYFQIQNVGANPLYLLFGSGVASANSYHEILKAGTAALDGTGGLFRSGTVVYTGPVAVGGTAASYAAFEIAP